MSEIILKTMVFDFHPSDIENVETYSNGFEDREHIMRLKGQDVEVELHESELSESINRADFYDIYHGDDQFEVCGEYLHAKQEVTTKTTMML